ncbi:MAG: pseudouridine synthase [Bacteroidales bacterium]|nr:pseudouridine synthase [Bacteroidales bacterium]
MFHSFEKDISKIALPDKFTCPFCYAPHILSIYAANQLQQYVLSRNDWKQELDGGKMFGVLVVKDINGKVGFVSAFSGQIQGKNVHEYFVPPVYDLIQENGFFKKGEKEISDINKKIKLLSENPVFEMFSQKQKDVDKALSEEKENMRLAKIKRDEKRLFVKDKAILDEFVRESQFQKAEYKRLQISLKQQLQEMQVLRDELKSKIENLSQKRRELSNILQRKIFEHFVFLNAKGERKTALDIWKENLPPAGAGECAAPRMLQYAYLNNLQPVAMAEFWWGKSPKGEIRRHGNFYKACKSKCEPILNFMLQGLDVEENRYAKESEFSLNIEVLYEDQWLVAVNKPYDVLSVAGKIPQPSVESWAKQKYGEAYVVHRLDMATSGILLIAKNMEICVHLRHQFETRLIHKEYVAVLDGIVSKNEGVIDLKLRPDYQERPYQIVDQIDGKEAVTVFRVLTRDDNKTRVMFYPQTGRTHQLRVHSAHELGLNCPIIGDMLYGTSAERLYLHAQKISFIHPVTKENVTLECKADF